MYDRCLADSVGLCVLELGFGESPCIKIDTFQKKISTQNPVSDIWACYVVVDKNELKRPRDGGLIRKTGMCVYMGLD